MIPRPLGCEPSAVTARPWLLALVLNTFQENYCFTAGTNLSESISSDDQCVCLNKTNAEVNYFGRRCDIPESIWTENGSECF